MVNKVNKNEVRKARHDRTRFYLKGTGETPRLNVYRSLKHIYAQIIDDDKGITLTSASTEEKALKAVVAEMDKTAAAKEVGKAIGKKAMELGIEKVVFDRGGYLYTGRVAALADGARESGLKF